jgi:XTP/dITP diphosphohydrolase
MPHEIFIATSNAGKLRDFAGAIEGQDVTICPLPNLSSLTVVEDGLTFEANARKKAENYSRLVPGRLVLADDSGLEVDALNGEPGVHSARYAAYDPHLAAGNTDDNENNKKLIKSITPYRQDQRTARFICVIAAAKDGRMLHTFEGKAEGTILDQPRGLNGFGYDPLFYFPPLKKTFAELTAEDKALYSHRGAAFRQFLAWHLNSRT